MALTKQDVIRQIQQGKVQSALEGMVQLSGLARDKEMQQRCVLLQSQLSHLNNKFAMGTFDQTDQLARNRITEAALDIAYELPSVVQAPPQYGQVQYSRTPQQSGSAWKTWGILLTGAGGLLLLLLVVNLMMNQQESNIGSPQNSFIDTNANPEVQPTQTQQAVKPSSQISQPVEKVVSPQDKFLGSWEGVMSANGITLGSLSLVLKPGNRSSIFSEAGSDNGTWGITENRQLMLTSSLGVREIYSVNWNGPNSFFATMVDGTMPEFVGLNISFSKTN
ncbi:MAG: hypothetical protein H7246_13480 [Phycisphaerae bacterium]|nr:hypothetical protein [Saprospiraceae bacterium]